MQKTNSVGNKAPKTAGKAAKDAGSSRKKEEEMSEETKALLQTIKSVPQSMDAQIAYDKWSETFISTKKSQEGADDTSSESSDAKQSRIVVYDKDGKKVQEQRLLLSGDFEDIASEGEGNYNAQGKRNFAESGKQNIQVGDSLSVLRFVRGKKSKRLEISPSGLTLKYNQKGSSSKAEKASAENPDGEELVLTNMAFYTGLHLWEIIAPISCNSIQFGVYNPVTKVEFLTSFKTTTPRTVTVCLDLNENLVKFWLNDRRVAGKNIKLRNNSGPYIPCVKISTEKNKLILNPFAREPSDFYEKEFDKRFTVRKFVLPHLHNMICVTKLPGAPNAAIASQQLKEKFKISSDEISAILMPHQGLSAEQQNSDSSLATTFCFLLFHFTDVMADFIKTHSSSSEVKIFQPYQIAEWFDQEDGEIPAEVAAPFHLIKSHIAMSKTSQEDAIKAIGEAFDKLIIQKDFKELPKGVGSDQTETTIVQQSFSDKLILKVGKDVKVIARESKSKDFDPSQVPILQPPLSMTDNVTLQVESKVFSLLFTKLNWSSLFKENNEIVNSLIQKFFSGLKKSARLNTSRSHVSFSGRLNITKFFIDNCIIHMKSHLDRLKRHYSNHQSVLSISNPLTQARIKAEQTLDSLASQPFIDDPNFSVEDANLILNILHDLQEQIWAQAKCHRCDPDVKSFVNTVSRPFSAFNRLSSFISWGHVGSEILHLQDIAEQGFFARENQTVSQFQNPAIEIQDVSEDMILNQDHLQASLGAHNRMLSSLVTENISLSKTINYMAPQQMKDSKGTSIDIISSSNNDFVLIGSSNRVNICSTSLGLTSLRGLDILEVDPHRMKKHKVVMEKVHQRFKTFEDFRKSIVKRSTPLSVLKDLKVSPEFEAAVAKKAAGTLKGALKSKGQPKKESKKKPQTKAPAPSANKVISAQKKKAETTAAHYDHAEEVEEESLVSLFGDIPLSKKEQEAEDKASKKSGAALNSVTQYKILGYILLSKPAILNAIDPVLVGCVYFDPKIKKYFMRFKRLTFAIPYLQNFISVDSANGQTINRITGKIIKTTEDIKELNKEILNHQETIVDLYTVFMRSQVFKKDWPKRDNKFAILDDLVDAEIEIEDCKRVIDFTRCSFATSASNQTKVHMLIEQADNKVKLIQYSLLDDVNGYDEQTMIMPLIIDQGKELLLEKEPQRVFQFDDKVLLLSEEKYQVLRQEDNFQVISEQALASPLKAPQSATILNLTHQSNLCCRATFKRYPTEALIPQQDWHLVINDSQAKYSLTDANQVGLKKLEKKVTTKSTQKIDGIDLKEAAPSDIIQIGNIVQSQSIGIIAKSNEDSVLTSSLGAIDLDNGLPLSHHWQIIRGAADKDAYQFSCKVQDTPPRELHLKQMEFEFSFVKRRVARDSRPQQVAEIVYDSASLLKKDYNGLIDESIQPSKLPLVVEHFTGAQINDTMHPNIITSPDSHDFCSNYPQPEFIFRLQSNQRFIPTEFIVRSRENRVHNGLPISQGLIFASDSFEALLNNTKHFSKMTDKQLKVWFDQRYQSAEYKNIMPLPCEPIAYFNMEEKTEIIVDASRIQRPVSFIKFIPTAFRKKPINYSSKAFNANQAEIQFFGVKGYELPRNASGSSLLQKDNESLALLDIAQKRSQVNLGVKVEVKQKDGFVIGNIDKVTLTEVRSARPQAMGTPISALDHLQIPNVIGVGRVTLGIKEEHSDCINDIVVDVSSQLQDPSNEGWELDGLSLSVKSYTDSSSLFSSESLQQNKPKLRRYLLDISNFDSLLGKLVAIAQEREHSSEDLRVAALQSILNYLTNNAQDNNYNEFIKLFKERTDVKKILHENFLDESLKYQHTSQLYLEKLGLLRSNSDFIGENFLPGQISRLFDSARPITKVKQVFDMLALCTPQRRRDLQVDLIQLLHHKLCEIELPKYQTPENIRLRSKLGINAFPFDKERSQISSATDDHHHDPSSQTTGVLPCRYELLKLNTFYQYTVDFGSSAAVQTIRLYFNSDDKCNYKVSVRVLVPGGSASGGEDFIIYRRIFDENMYFQVCDQAHKKDIVSYFGPEDKNGGGTSTAASAELLNSIAFDLGGYTGRYMKVQVELLDSFKSVHKTQSVTQVLIRPLFLGKLVPAAAQSGSFEVREAKEKGLLKKVEYHGGALTHSYYAIENEPLSTSCKACIVVVSLKGGDQQQQFQAQKAKCEDATDPHQEEKQDAANEALVQEDLAKERESLKKALVGGSKAMFQKKAIRVQVSKIKKLLYCSGTGSGTSEEPSKPLSLRYLLSLGELLAGQTLEVLSSNPPDSTAADLEEKLDFKGLFLVLFKSFTVFDRESLYPSVGRLLNRLLVSPFIIKDKSAFLCGLLHEYLLSGGPSDQHQKQQFYSQKNVINFIKQQKNIDLKSFLAAFAQTLGGLGSSPSEAKESWNMSQIIEQIERPQKQQDQVISLQSVLSFLTIFDDISQEAKSGDGDLVEAYLNIQVSLILRCPQMSLEAKQTSVSHGLMALKFSTQILKRLMGTPGAKLRSIADHQSLATLLILGIQSEDKELQKLMKDVLMQVASDTGAKSAVTRMVHELLSWYKEKGNMKKASYYRDLEEQQQLKEKGAGLFYKHMSQVFDVYMQLLQTKQNEEFGSGEIEKAYKELGHLINDLLSVLISEQESDNYEENFFEVWIQVFKTVCYLAQHGLAQKEAIDDFVSQFFLLKPVNQEALYPEFHTAMQTSNDTFNPSSAVALLKSLVGLLTNERLRVGYKFIDGIFNILTNGRRDKPLPAGSTAIVTKFKDSKQGEEIIETLVGYLETHLNFGVFTGVVGADLDLVMKLDIANFLVVLLQHAKTVSGGEDTLFESYVKSEAERKEIVVKKLIQWMILNYYGSKSKTSPAANRIYTLSMGLEDLLGRISASEKTVSLSLPILMKTILSVDFKLRDLIHQDTGSSSSSAQKQRHSINYERAIQIQKTVNTLFLSFFKSWVHLDSLAKKFLTELNGFDFLLDRLFSKAADHQGAGRLPPQSLPSESDQKPQAKEDGGGQEDLTGLGEYLIGDDAMDQDGNDEGFSEEDGTAAEDDFIMSLVMQKVAQYKEQEDKQQQPGDNKAKPKPAQPVFPQKGGLFVKEFKKSSCLGAGESKKEKLQPPAGAAKDSAVETPDTLKEVETKLALDDWGKNLKIIWSSDKEAGAKNSYQGTQWNKFKNGTKNRLYNYQITDQIHQYEYVVKFDLECVIMLSEVQIGVVYNWSTFDPDCNYEPLSILLEGGSEEGNVEWRALLHPIYDDGYSMNSITVYGHCFTEISKVKETSIEGILSKIGAKEARYLTFRLRKPLMACSDQSIYISQEAKNKSYGFSFISVMGSQIPSPRSIFGYLIDIQKENSLEVVSKFFANEFTEAFELISEQDSIIEKIKNAFDKLAILMNTKASLIKPIFLAICAKNQSLGDWIMDNRLISMEPNFIKKEQMAFLGDIISSNREKQLDKVLKLKNFIFEQINLAASGKLTLSPDQQLLLSRYLKLFNVKLREYALNWQSSGVSAEIELSFTPQDLDNAVALMSQCDCSSEKEDAGKSKKSSSSKLFNTLTEFTLILLLPPKPLVNRTIQVNDYINKKLLVEAGTTDQTKDLQNLLFCSIMSSTNDTVIGNILGTGKLDRLIHALKDWDNPSSISSDQDVSKLYTYAQILFNCSRQSLFRAHYKSTLPFEIYSFLRQEEEGGPLMRAGLNDMTVNLLVHTIRDLILGGDDELEKFSELMKSDIVQASDRNDVEFINKVIVPILQAEEKVPVTISVVNQQSLQKGKPNLEPIYAGSDVNQSGGAGGVSDNNFFLKSQILNKKQKVTFGKMFKQLTQDKVENFEKLHSSKWDLIFEDKQHKNQSPAQFRNFVKAVSNRSNVIIFIQCKVQEQTVVFGGFTNKQFPALGDSWAHEFDYQIPYSDANFVCYYTPEKELHYTMTQNKCFGYIYTDYEEGGALSISGDFFLISWSYEFQNSCGNIYDMKCVEEQQAMSYYNNMEIQHIEIWGCDLGQKAVLSEGKIKSELKKHPLYKAISPFNFFRQNLVFEVSKNMPLALLAKELLGKNQVFIKYPEDIAYEGTKTVGQVLGERKEGVDLILDLVIKRDAPKAQEEGMGILQIAGKEEPEDSDKISFKRDQPLLKKFESKGGIMDLIKAAKQAVNEYKGEKLKDIWSLWLNEIQSFSKLPDFFQTFCKDREKENMIYKLISGEYDIKSEGIADASSPENQRIIQQQEELHIEMVKYSYQIVSSVFETHESAELRDSCLENGTFERFIERIGQLSSEKKRQKVVQVKKAEEEVVVVPEKTKKVKEEKKMLKKAKKDNQKRKGVGYTTGVGTTWNVSEYLKSKEAKSSQAANIVNILKHMIKSKDWVAPPEIKAMLLESALLPTLEAAFRSGSLLDMAKEYDLNMAYLGFIQELANHPTLIDLVLDIGDEYEPRQKEPIHTLINRLNDLGTIFLSCLTEESKTSLDEEQIKPRNLAEKIQETNKVVQEKITEQHFHKAQQSLADIMSLPLSEAYWNLLSSKRFDYMSMKNSSGSYTHFYQADLPKALNPPVSKLVRLAQEIADLSNSLPCDYTNAIFCMVDKERVDVMKCIIMGASGTPYAHGAFLYDLFFENSYPNSPPKCQLVTTGGNTVRFNPNLYNNGKVCLSLLGTWRGQSTENWDPKLSTILQVLLSLQAIIMSNEVYFNEPGYEHEAGTTDGERKNEGYANIVRYCNVKFAIIDAIKNPPPGFEKIIRSNFYLKKNEVLREVKEWVDKAKTSDALYTGLVFDHNYHWAPQISAEGKYAEMMEAIYKELKETLESLPSPFEDAVTGQVIERQFSKNEENLDTKPQKGAGGTVVKIEDIDVSYEPLTDQQIQQHQINVDDDKVKDRWSRYIGAMGIEAVAKQAESRILICGMGPLGVEIAKNIILAGCKELILFDDATPILEELSGQFFITEQEVQSYNYSKTRAHYSRDKLQQLNFYVKVTVLESSTDLTTYVKAQSDLKVVVLTDMYQISTEDEHTINTACRANKTAFINAMQNGLFGKVFNDFGAEFLVLDKDGEELQEVMIKDIVFDEATQTTVVKLLDGFKHRFADNDQVSFKEVLGMTKLDDLEKSINDAVVTIRVINPSSFSIDEDARLYAQYEGNGIAKQVKVPKKVEFKTLKECEEDELAGNDAAQDANLLISDFEKLDNKHFLHSLYKAMAFIQSQDDYALDEGDPLKACDAIIKKAKEMLPKDMKLDDKQLTKLENLAYIFTFTHRSSFPPIAALLGGVVAQEIIKAITQKFMPIHQMFYFDCAELYPLQEITALDEESKRELAGSLDDYERGRYYALKTCIGLDLLESIQDCKVFMIGAGAIGCELLKNYAMIGLGTGKQGKIIVTDPDVIEVSNLNRQFLFREKHLRKPKSQTAAAAAIQMNPGLKNKISARLDKIHDGTSHIYNEAFFQDQSIVTNALDNVQARLFIDAKCVAARVPLIDSGTLGPKGHVQVVLPDHLTESYSSQRDPDDNAGEIPHCTLKMFPEEALHCVEWAKDLFGNLYTLQPQSFNRVIIEEKDRKVNLSDQQEKTALKKVIKLIKKQPTDFEACILQARQRFQKHFVNDIKQLLHVYPLDKMTKDGRPFWSLPKRPPHPVEYDEENPTHRAFIAAFTCLQANLYGVKIPYENPRSEEAKREIAHKASEYKMADFVPNDQKASQIENEVDKEKKNKESGETDQQQQEETQMMAMTSEKADEVKELQKAYKDLVEPLRKSQELRLCVEEFEKDNDVNFHIDFIHAMANVRAQNYKLEEMDWITVKIKAGRIVPALATTTAAIAALQVIELIKYLKDSKLEEHRNSFLNLAVPSLMMSEPGKAEKTKLGSGEHALEVTLWDRWEYEAPGRNVTLLKVVEYLEETYKLSVRDIFYGSIPLFMHALQLGGSRQAALDKAPLLDLINTNDNKEAVEFIDLTVTFVDPQAQPDKTGSEKVLEGVPPVRVVYLS